MNLSTVRVSESKSLRGMREGSSPPGGLCDVLVSNWEDTCEGTSHPAVPQTDKSGFQ